MRFPRRTRHKQSSLSADVELGEAGSQVIVEQEPVVAQNSRLLNLPGEIRLAILRSIFSHHLIHVSIARTEEGAQFGWPQGRVKAAKQPRVQSKWCSQRCSYKFNDTPDGLPSSGGRGRHDVQIAPGQALDVMLSCRQMYREAVELVYTENVFDFVDLLPFADFASQFSSSLHKLRYVQARHKVPTLGHYSRHDPPAGLRAAVKVSWDGPAMFVHFLSVAMPQLREMKLLFERCWMTIEYEAEYSRRHAEWVRYITQLANFPGVGQPYYVRALGLPWNPHLQALDD